MNKVWSEVEKDYIRQNAGTMTDAVIAANLSQNTGRKVSLQAVRKQRQKMKIAKKPGRGICALMQEEKDRPQTDDTGVPANLTQ